MNQIKKIRLKLKLKQDEFSKSIKISQSSLSLIECGERKPSLRALYYLRTKYNVDLNKLVKKLIQETK